MRAFTTLASLAAAALLCSCDGQKPEPPKTPPAPAKPAASQAAKPAESLPASAAKGADQTANYLTGKTPLEIKKRQENKINDIQKKANKQLDDALKE
jgi:hypothetical protein